jgi:hypothetical protein
MNLICAECAYRRLSTFGDIVQKTRFNEANRIKSIIGNARRSFICFDCGQKLKDGTACASIHAEGENFIRLVLPSDETTKHYTDNWGNYGGGND